MNQFAEHRAVLLPHPFFSLTNICSSHSSKFLSKESVVQLIPPMLRQGSLVNAQSLPGLDGAFWFHQSVS